MFSYSFTCCDQINVDSWLVLGRIADQMTLTRIRPSRKKPDPTVKKTGAGSDPRKITRIWIGANIIQLLFIISQYLKVFLNKLIICSINTARKVRF